MEFFIGQRVTYQSPDPKEYPGQNGCSGYIVKVEQHFVSVVFDGDNFRSILRRDLGGKFLFPKEKNMNTEPTTKPGKMSGDRVHFTISERDLVKTRYRELIEETLGIKADHYKTSKPLKVICRPSQFARFIILRYTKYAEPNNMAGLEMKLVSPEPERPDNLIDCSRNPNTAVGEIAE